MDPAQPTSPEPTPQTVPAEPNVTHVVLHGGVGILLGLVLAAVFTFVPLGRPIEILLLVVATILAFVLLLRLRPLHSGRRAALAFALLALGVAVAYYSFAFFGAGLRGS